jgi:hypothetical protein
MLFAWILFAILGWCVFVSSTPARTVLMIVFIVLMLLWLLAGVTGYEIPRIVMPR